MFVPYSIAVALLMMIASAVCWGSWANTYKGVKNYRFELFYWDYAVGIFLISLVLAFTLGSSGHDSASFLNNANAADRSNIISTMIGGAVFNLANLLRFWTAKRTAVCPTRAALSRRRASSPASYPGS
jgi:glucose uptake protein